MIKNNVNKFYTQYYIIYQYIYIYIYSFFCDHIVDDPQETIHDRLRNTW